MMRLTNCILCSILCVSAFACGDDDHNSDGNHNHAENNDSQNNPMENNQSGLNNPIVSNENNPTENNPTENNENNPTVNNENNVVVVNNVNNPPNLEIACFEELLDAWPLNEGVSTAEVAVQQVGGEFSGTIDAAAGGAMNAPSSSFVYVDLDTGARVEVDDFTAYENLDWDLAFKRVVINSSNSGPGQVEVAKLADTAFADATLAAATVWASDETMDAACIPDFDPVGNPITAFNLLNLDNPSGSESWYTYSQMGVLPQPDIYLVKNADATNTYKFEVQAWAGGEFTVRWAEVSQ